MRCPRLTYQGAFHHCTARGIGGSNIFFTPSEKGKFVYLLQEKVRRYRVRILAFCIMDNHYHLVLQNITGKMSEFFRSLKSHYASWYQWAQNGRGYVFQGRFHSTLIQEGAYLESAILYVLGNPIRAGIVARPEAYEWSSASLYGQPREEWIDGKMVLGIFGDRSGLFRSVESFLDSKLEVMTTPFGPVMGDIDFLQMSIEKFDRREAPDPRKHRRRDDVYFQPIGQVIHEFEKSNGIGIDSLNTRTHKGKLLRGELLVRLRDHAGMTLKQISEMDVFADLQYKSLPQLYKNARKKFILL